MTCGDFSTVWFRNYGGSNSETANAIQQTIDGGYIIAGNTLSTDGDVNSNNGGVDFWLVKTDATGNTVWERTYGGSSTEKAKAIHQTADGGYIVCGDGFSNDGDVGGTKGGVEFWVLKLDNVGNIEWKKVYGGSLSDNAEWIEPTTDGGYIIIGSTHSSDGDVLGNQGISDAWLLKIDAAGTVMWSQTYGGSLENTGKYIQQTPDGGYIFVGSAYSFTNDYDAIIFKINADGSLSWTQFIGGTAMDWASNVHARRWLHYSWYNPIYRRRFCR